jgi:hypothetical protein
LVVTVFSMSRLAWPANCYFPGPGFSFSTRFPA